MRIRRADQNRQIADGRADRFGKKPGPGSETPNEPAQARRQVSVPHVVARAGRSDLTQLLGRTVLEARVQQICREWGLTPHTGTGLSRSYLAHDAGVELAANVRGTVTTIFLHFHDDDGFRPYDGEIPGGGGTVPRRAHLWAALGRPAECVDPFLGDYGPSDTWLFPHLVLNARYTHDADHLQRITLTLPAQLRAA
ncbi:MAG TPA: hypothetical protein VGP57_13720 [Actinoplanes sp.]|nr:hypothetical protein [Actinoplanes sp.]